MSKTKETPTLSDIIDREPRFWPKELVYTKVWIQGMRIWSGVNVASLLPLATSTQENACLDSKPNLQAWVLSWVCK